MCRIRSSINMVVVPSTLAPSPLRSGKSLPSARPAGRLYTLKGAVTNVSRSVNAFSFRRLRTRPDGALHLARSAGDLAGVGARKTRLPGGPDGRVGVRPRAIDAGEDDVVPGLEARVAARVHDPDLVQALLCRLRGRAERLGMAEGLRIGDEDDRPAGPARGPHGPAVPGCRSPRLG